MAGVSDLKKQYQAGLKPEAVLDEVYAQIEKDSAGEKPLNAFISLTKELAYEQAKSLKDFSLPLAGIPVAVKDNIHVKGELTTCGSKILSNYRAVFDATAVQKLKAAGALIIGKTNMDEFAMGSSSESSYFGPTLNPRNRKCVPGGSSGGSAAAVAAGFAPLALGSDTGGSIRQPAAFCGVVGFKPTYGRVSRYGLTAYASSLDQIGPFSQTVEDSALLYSVLAGPDAHDSTCFNQPVNFSLEKMKESIKGLRVGIPEEYFVEGLDPEIKEAIEKVTAMVKAMGAEVKKVSLPHTPYATAAYYIIAPAEASANLARFDGIRYGVREEGKNLLEIYTKSRGKGFGAEVKRRIMIGTYVLSSGYYDAYYLSAQKARTLIRRDFEKVFQEVDVLFTPTAPTTAFELGAKTSDPIQMYLSDIFTLSTNLAGVPGISIPVGTDSKGLPMGMQIMAGLLEEQKLFQAAYAVEQGLKGA